ncbi:MAG TPA: heavy metal transporter, partial [Cyclobacteriaceae bacterium]
MGKIVRKSLPLEVSVGLLLLIFILSFLLAGQIFGEHNEGKNLYFGMLLVSTAVIIMVLVLWEELFFPVKVKPEQGEVVF